MLVQKPLVMEIPLHTLKFGPEELKNKMFRVNISAATSVAPRKRLWWNLPESQQDFEKSLVPAVFLK